MIKQLKLTGAMSVTMTTPAKPLRGVTVMIDSADVPTITGTGDDAVRVKSGRSAKVKVAVVVWDRAPLVPSIVTVNDPNVMELQDKAAVWVI